MQLARRANYEILIANKQQLLLFTYIDSHYTIIGPLLLFDNYYFAVPNWYYFTL